MMSTTNLGSECSSKIEPRHLERLAIVYVRQSTAQQVLQHQESTRLQYGLKEEALKRGWRDDQVLVIDEDLGKSGASSEGRTGFQRLVSEVSLDHVGIILGIEMSRLARSCKDWHQLLEICGVFGTLIMDAQGVYDPMSLNDRMLLGLKGTISEVELHMIKQRMNQGRLNKARRGDLSFRLPAGYLRRPSGEITLEPDEQVQSVVRLIFNKFEELGTINAVLQHLVRHEIKIGGRSHIGPAKGEVQWRRPNRTTITNMLNSPLYAGAYAYGRRQVDPRRKRPGFPDSGSISKPREEWTALIRDRLPAYITWEQHEGNLERLRANRSCSDALGSARRGPGLLSGLLVCGWCDRRLIVSYNADEPHRYGCGGGYSQYGETTCFSLNGPYLEEAVTKQLLRAIEPAALELSLEAVKSLERERNDLMKVWEQGLERAAYEVGHAARQYHAVDPENRLVARTLERQWEEKLLSKQKLEDKYQRFRSTQARGLTEQEREKICRLASDIPALWSDPKTTDQERKTILRAVIERVIVQPQGRSEKVKLRVDWVGGSTTQCEATRAVPRTEQLSYYPELCERVKSLVASGISAREIAQELNRQGLRPANPRGIFDAQHVAKLMRKLGLVSKFASSYVAQRDLRLAENEWTLPGLARELNMPEGTLGEWVKRGLVTGRREGVGPRSRRILWADKKHIGALRQRLAKGPAYWSHRRWVEEADAITKTQK